MKYRVAAVSYVNTLPFLQGLHSPVINDNVEVILAHPARCAELLETGEVDIALCPIGALPGLGKYHVITDYCIGCDGPVRTVSVYSHRPLNELTHIVLSAESRTSNLLVQILSKNYWRNNIAFLTASSISSISSASSGFLFIGDICFEKEKEFAYRTDLGQAWKDWTGLPFAFAVWVSKREIDPGFILKLNTAFAEGIGKIAELKYPAGTDRALMQTYLTTNISYTLDDRKKEAMGKFLLLAH